VGSGTAGKTTLVHRLREKSFSEDALTMTDGVDMSHLFLEGIDFTVTDFAGQKEYFHTHGIFFKTDALYLVVYMPRTGNSFQELEGFLQMVQDAAPGAPVMLVTTRCDEATLSQADEAGLRSRHPSIMAVTPIDSKSGSGIKEFQETLVRIAMSQPATVRKVPALFFRLEQRLCDLGRDTFSLTAEEYSEIAEEEFGLDKGTGYLARDLFHLWGAVHVLRNGEVVLQPQQLADVLACVITKNSDTLTRIGDAREGLLKHDDSSLQAIWGKYPRHLWQCQGVRNGDGDGDEGSSSFIDLLHQSGGIAFLDRVRSSVPLAHTSFLTLLSASRFAILNLPHLII
jgi:GTPase SAR1 family protein